MYAFTVIVAVLISIVAIVHLARTDPKRRRVFGLDEYEKPRWVKTTLAVMFLPGLLLLVTGDGAGFTIWLGALTVIGWGVAALDPHRSAAIGNLFVRWGGGVKDAVVAGSTRTIAFVRAVPALYRTLRDAPARIEALEARVAELEAERASGGYGKLTLLGVTDGDDQKSAVCESR